MKQTIGWSLIILCLLLGGLVLVAWPLLAAACLMGVPVTGIAGVFYHLFYMGLLCYPLVYIMCFIACILPIKMIADPSGIGLDRRFRLIFACLPLLYVAAVIGAAYCFFIFSP